MDDLSAAHTNQMQDLIGFQAHSNAECWSELERKSLDFLNHESIIPEDKPCRNHISASATSGTWHQ